MECLTRICQTRNPFPIHESFCTYPTGKTLLDCHNNDLDQRVILLHHSFDECCAMYTDTEDLGSDHARCLLLQYRIPISKRCNMEHTLGLFDLGPSHVFHLANSHAYQLKGSIFCAFCVRVVVSIKWGYHRLCSAYHICSACVCSVIRLIVICQPLPDGGDEAYKVEVLFFTG